MIRFHCVLYTIPYFFFNSVSKNSEIYFSFNSLTIIGRIFYRSKLVKSGSFIRHFSSEVAHIAFSKILKFIFRFGSLVLGSFDMAVSFKEIVYIFVLFLATASASRDPENEKLDEGK